MRKNIKATVIFNNLKGNAGQQWSWLHALRLALDINQVLPLFIVQLLSRSALLCVKLATFDCLWQNMSAFHLISAITNAKETAYG